MHKISFSVVLFYSLPQCFLYVWLGFQLINYKPSVLRLFYLSLTLIPFIYCVRRLELPYGLHALILTIATIILAYFFLKIPIFNCALAIIIGSIIAIALESLLLPLVIEITETTFAEVVNSDFLSIVFSFPQLLIMALINAYLHYKKLYLFSLK